MKSRSREESFYLLAPSSNLTKEKMNNCPLPIPSPRRNLTSTPSSRTLPAAWREWSRTRCRQHSCPACPQSPFWKIQPPNSSAASLTSFLLVRNASLFKLQNRSNCFSLSSCSMSAKPCQRGNNCTSFSASTSMTISTPFSMGLGDIYSGGPWSRSLSSMPSTP